MEFHTDFRVHIFLNFYFSIKVCPRKFGLFPHGISWTKKILIKFKKKLFLQEISWISSRIFMNKSSYKFFFQFNFFHENSGTFLLEFHGNFFNRNLQLSFFNLSWKFMERTWKLNFIKSIIPSKKIRRLVYVVPGPKKFHLEFRKNFFIL